MDARRIEADFPRQAIDVGGACGLRGPLASQVRLTPIAQVGVYSGDTGQTQNLETHHPMITAGSSLAARLAARSSPMGH
jgi:hypothetical protein